MFQEIITFFQNTDPVLGALYATLFTWGMTAFGASFVFLFKTMNRVFLDGMLGFTGGVMVAASFWSLLAPGIEMSEGEYSSRENICRRERKHCSRIRLLIRVSKKVRTTLEHDTAEKNLFCYRREHGRGENYSENSRSRSRDYRTIRLYQSRRKSLLGDACC